MAGLDVDDKAFVGRFRGESGLEKIEVRVGNKQGTPPGDVAQHLAVFERRLKRAVEALDARYPAGSELDADGLAAVIQLSAWAHAEWVRIHPFANGNGRTARFLANFVFMRYGLPPVIRMRPRPDGGYGAAGSAAMDGNWQPTVVVFRRILLEALGTSTVEP
jgi:Fic/DOC family